MPVVDVTGCVLLPGLLDVHVHLTMDADVLNKTGLGENDTFAVLRAAHVAEVAAEQYRGMYEEADGVEAVPPRC